MTEKGKTYPIVGIQDGLAPPENELRKVEVRMEIDQWFTSEDIVHVNQRALFFPALREFCNKSPKDKLSYFQVAGQSVSECVSSPGHIPLPSDVCALVEGLTIKMGDSIPRRLSQCLK